jgi:hypothetical protein
MALGWEDRHPILREEWGADARAGRALGQHRMGRRLRWGPLRNHRLTGGALLALPGREDEGDAGAFVATPPLACGGDTAPSAPQSLGGVAAVFFTRPRRADGRGPASPPCSGGA